MSAYEKQDCYRGPRVLLSPLVKVTDDYLVFSFRGVPLRAGKGVTAELLDGADKVLAVPFTREGDLASFLQVAAVQGWQAVSQMGHLRGNSGCREDGGDCGDAEVPAFPPGRTPG